MNTSPMYGNPPQYSVKKASFAKLIGVDHRTIDRWIEAGIIPSIKMPSQIGKDGKHHGTVLIPLNEAINSINKYRTKAGSN